MKQNIIVAVCLTTLVEEPSSVSIHHSALWSPWWCSPGEFKLKQRFGTRSCFISVLEEGFWDISHLQKTKPLKVAAFWDVVPCSITEVDCVTGEHMVMNDVGSERPWNVGKLLQDCQSPLTSKWDIWQWSPTDQIGLAWS